jgi:hypothetical protein
MVADTDVDRANPGAVLDFLRSKYNIPKLRQMDTNVATALVCVPRDGAQPSNQSSAAQFAILDDRQRPYYESRMAA